MEFFFVVVVVFTPFHFTILVTKNHDRSLNKWLCQVNKCLVRVELQTEIKSMLAKDISFLANGIMLDIMLIILF